MEDLNMEEISRMLAEQENMPAEETRLHLEAVVDLIIQTLQEGGRIEIRGLGSFRVRERKARWARNIRAGTSVYVPPHLSPVFLPGTALKALLNPGNKEKIEKDSRKD